MKGSLFSKLMLYLTLFFVLLCGLTYLILSTGFENYYLKSREDNLKTNVKEIAEIYTREGATEELTPLIERKKEEGVVIEIIQPGTTSATVESLSFIQTHLPKSITLAQGQGKHDGSGKGQNGNENGHNADGETHGNGQGQQQKLEDQINEHASGEMFTVITGNNDHEVEWMTYKETVTDGAQIVGRIPSYSIHEVIQMVRHYLIFFLIIIFIISLIFAYFFSRSISKPLVNLKNISREMGNLNFSEKYKGKRKDEIGELGETLNGISAELESTIGKLQVELNKERTLEKMRKRFTAQVSHEIQTPLAVIKSYAEALEDGLIDDETEKVGYYQTVAKEADKVSTIASDLLDLAQIESKAYSLKKEKESPVALMEAVIERYAQTHPEKNIVYHNAITSELTVNIDRKRMEQVLYNLLNNAIKHVEPETGKIEVTSKVMSENWTVDVYNEGQSIPENDIDQIWEYFYKAKSDKRGTGLGLAIVKGIILGHGGNVFVENEENGVRFKVTVPIL
ncbi:MAG: HAMP domain-containing sensor histidine kinase [Eubacterium sp.]